MKSIKLFILAVMSVALFSCEEEKWSEEPLTAEPVYQLTLTTLLEVEATTMEILYIDIYRNKNMLIESTNTVDDSGTFFKYDTRNYSDTSADGYNITFEITNDEGTKMQYSVTSENKSGVVTLKIVDADDNSILYDQSDVAITETTKLN